MTAHPFTLYEVENVITDESAQVGDYASSDATEKSPATLRDALDALLAGCWDTLDIRNDAVIAYPADYVQDYRTGDYSASEVIISGSPRNVARLLALYDARKRA